MKTMNIGTACAGMDGSALVIGIVFLLILSMLGVAGMKTTILEERMAGNLRDRELAFQAAEAGLRDAETVLRQPVLPNFNAPGLGLYQEHAGIWNIIDWDDTDSAEYSYAFNRTSAPPRYIIEEMPLVSGLNVSASPDEPVEDEGLFRITAKGVGGTDMAVVLLQSTFKR
ncbi:MAG: PilX N-terminal domain-containing pilus assembly protein [Desulfovibrionales bacterium]